MRRGKKALRAGREDGKEWEEGKGVMEGDGGVGKGKVRPRECKE